MSSQTPGVLAARVRSQLIRRKLRSPSLKVLRAFFDTLYYASLRTEEGRPILVHVVYLDSRSPDPTPPMNIRAHRWSCVALGERVPFTVGNVVKLALASDPRSSALAVDTNDEGELQIWGILDQQNLFLDFLNYDSDEGPERPGLFQASIVGLGSVAVYLEYEKLAELRVNELVGKAVDLFGRPGPIRSFVEREVIASLKRIGTALGSIPNVDRSFTDGLLFWNWVGSICRIILRVQRFGHGGALLFTPTASSADLKVNYKINYDRLRQGLERQAVEQATVDAAWHETVSQYLGKNLAAIPSKLVLDQQVAENNVKDIKAEVEGAVWFISLLSRVDGCIWMTPDLHVRGFGVEITTNQEPNEVLIAQDVRASERRLRRADYRLFGTRHRSMMRYVARHAGSVGVVISQEGSVRFMTEIAGKLVLWDNARLQLHVPSRWQPSAASATPNSA